MPDAVTGSARGTAQTGAFRLCTLPEYMPLTALPAGPPLARGDFVFSGGGQRLLLRKPVLLGMDGVTYRTDQPGVWAKIYDPAALTNFSEAKARRMLSRAVARPGLCWPTDLALDGEGRFAGLLVPPSRGTPLHVVLLRQAAHAGTGAVPARGRRSLGELTRTLLRMIRYLHGKNILLGCLNPAAIRVAGPGEVYFTETDNYQIEGFPSVVYNTAFLPPERRGRTPCLCGKADENYAVALLAFLLTTPARSPADLERLRQVAAQLVEGLPEQAPGDGVPSARYGQSAAPRLADFLKDDFMQRFLNA